jgi:predicted DCC family thiol-disulfide oxidoreductase YuxK
LPHTIEPMVILFDGVCNMCNWFVQFIIKRDKKNIFQFASLQSNYGTSFLKHFGLTDKGLDTVMVYDGKELITQSDATIRILTSLGSIWKAAIIFKIVPHFIRNRIYTLLAKRRYSLFGKRDSCMVPDEKIKGKFLDEQSFL